ncbi:MAG TPA: alpha-amylase family glycosyl hydrolase [Polyangia bacterium]
MKHPLLYQLNTRVLLGELGAARGRPATLDDVPDAFLDEVAARGFEWVWPLGMWQTGPLSRQVSRTRPENVEECRAVLPDLRPDDICGSPFAIQSYTAHEDFGGDAALARLRSRLARRGQRLLLDFVINHTGLDHAWIESHPEYFVAGTEDDLARQPHNYIRLRARGREIILAHGRDPYFPGWTDTVQLNYCHAGCRAAMEDELRRVAARCDGVRCDMAMLVLPEVFQRTWGDKVQPRDGTPAVTTSFWREVIGRMRRDGQPFVLAAEVYWDLEWEMQQQGFDFTYDKRLYDRLRAGAAGPVRGHLGAAMDYQDRSVRFLENHDEPRAAATFPPGAHEAAAVVSFLVPGLRFFHEGQLDGRKVHVSMHLGRRPPEPVDPAIRNFYDRLLAVLRRPEAHAAEWRLLGVRPAWDGNPTWDQFIATAWEPPGQTRLLAAVNYGPTQGQAYVDLGPEGPGGGRWLLRDLMGAARYVRDGNELRERGLYLDLPAWGYHVFELSPA